MYQFIELEYKLKELLWNIPTVMNILNGISNSLGVENIYKADLIQMNIL